jgi:hypothetical protein
VVHHRNGDRLDNRPQNLELWSTAQPKGQRVADKLDFALALLQRYDADAAAALGLGLDPSTGLPTVEEPDRPTGQRALEVVRRTPERIRTVATAVRGRRPRPLDDGGQELLFTC